MRKLRERERKWGNLWEKGGKLWGRDLLPANGKECILGTWASFGNPIFPFFAKTKPPCVFLSATIQENNFEKRLFHINPSNLFLTREKSWILNGNTKLVLDQVFVVNISGKVGKVWESCRQQYMSENRRGMKRRNKLLIRQPTTSRAAKYPKTFQTSRVCGNCKFAKSLSWLQIGLK